MGETVERRREAMLGEGDGVKDREGRGTSAPVGLKVSSTLSFLRHRPPPALWDL